MTYHSGWRQACTRDRSRSLFLRATLYRALSCAVRSDRITFFSQRNWRDSVSIIFH